MSTLAFVAFISAASHLRLTRADMQLAKRRAVAARPSYGRLDLVGCFCKWSVRGNWRSYAYRAQRTSRTGKNTIGKALASRQSAAYVRVDEIEHALRQSMGATQEIGAAGYAVAFAIVSSNLRLGKPVVADSVNPVAESRQGWRAIVRDIRAARILEVEIICSDKDEHRRRVESRAPDIKGFTLPSWSSVEAHNYTAWTEPRLIVDTAHSTAIDAVLTIERRLGSMVERRLPAP